MKVGSKRRHPCSTKQFRKVIGGARRGEGVSKPQAGKVTGHHNCAKASAK